MDARHAVEGIGADGTNLNNAEAANNAAVSLARMTVSERREALVQQVEDAMVKVKHHSAGTKYERRSTQRI